MQNAIMKNSIEHFLFVTPLNAGGICKILFLFSASPSKCMREKNLPIYDSI